MKNTAILFVILFTGIFFSSFNNSEEVIYEEATFEIPENVNTILNESCIMCHNKESKNNKAKLKFKIDELPNMKVSKQISKLSKIVKEVNKGDMPPEKFLAKNPDKALSADDKKILVDWAKSYSEELAK